MNKVISLTKRNVGSIRILFEIIRAECMKVIHSKVFLITILASLIMPVMAGFVMFVLKNPEVSRNIGLLGKEASIQGTPDWPGYFGLLGKMFPFGMFLIIFGFVVSWIFGREYSDRTLKDLLTLPISRFSVVFAKFIATSVWCLFLFIIAFVFAILIGHLINLSGWSIHLMYDAFFIFLTSFSLSLFLTTPAALLSSFSRGYLAPLGFIVLAIILANFISGIGYTAYYPWAIPGFYTLQKLAGEGVKSVSIIITCLTGLLCFLGTYAWWRYADQN